MDFQESPASHHHEGRDNIATLADDMKSQMSDLQATLDGLFQRMGKLDGAIRAMNVGRKLDRVSSELPMVLWESSKRSASLPVKELPSKESHTAWSEVISVVPVDSSAKAASKSQGIDALFNTMSQSAGQWFKSEAPEVKDRNKIRRTSFIDLAVMKDEVRRAVMKPSYDVTNFYADDGWAQRVARSQCFEYFTLCIIFINTVWVAVDTEIYASETADMSTWKPVLITVDNLFTSYFVVELCIRFLAFESKWNCFKDKWFRFDLVLLLPLIVDTWIFPLVVNADIQAGQIGDIHTLRTLRLLRILRMARLAKLVRMVPELMIVIKGIGMAVRSVMHTWILMLAVTYIFAIAFRQLSLGLGVGKKYFDGVSQSMYTLLLKATLPDLAEFMTEISSEDILLAVLLLLFILLVTLTVMNMLIGILVDVVGVVSKVENYELQVAFVKHKLLKLMHTSGLDEDGNYCVSRKEFSNALVKPEAAKILKDVGVDPVGLVDYMEYIFKDVEELDFPSFMEVILQLRGSNPASVKDVVDMRKWVAEEFRMLERNLGVRGRPRLVPTDSVLVDADETGLDSRSSGGPAASSIPILSNGDVEQPSGGLEAGRSSGEPAEPMRSLTLQSKS